MRALALPPGAITEVVAGTILCQDLTAAGEHGRVKLRKGRIVQMEDISVLQAAGQEIHFIEMDSGDIHEDEAATRLARALAGPGVEIRDPVESQVHMRASYGGLLQVSTVALEQINCLPDMSAFTLYDGQPVTLGKAVAATKVTPLAVPETVVEEAERIAAEHRPVVQVHPFLGGAVGVVVRERLARGRDTFESAIQTKIGWFGSSVLGIRYVPDEVSAIAKAVSGFVDGGAVLVLAAGVNSTDPLDLTVQALESVGARTERRGVPAHPGSTCWLAYLGDVPIFGLALCGMFSQTTVLDLLLPRFLAGRRVTAPDLARLGHGGVLGKDMAFRFPTYTGRS